LGNQLNQYRQRFLTLEIMSGHHLAHGNGNSDLYENWGVILLLMKETWSIYSGSRQLIL